MFNVTSLTPGNYSVHVLIKGFSPKWHVQAEELRKRQILDMVRILGFPEEKIKRVEETLAKYASVDGAIEEIRKLSLEGYRVAGNPKSDPKKIICLLYTSPSPRDLSTSRMPSSA